MLRLIEPCEAYLPSYTEAFDEYRAYPRRSGNPYRNPHVQDVLAYFSNMKNALNLPAGYVGSTTFWLVDDEQQRFLGQIDVRHALTDRLLRYGGHIGYAVRLGEWNKGYGTLMLSLVLPYAKELGTTRCLITCDDDNPGSARVMEKNGFTLGDKIDNVIDGTAIITRRYWKNL